jgi:hypothetical protein
MSISRVFRRPHLDPYQKVWVKFAEQDEEDDAVIALILDMETSAELSEHRKADIQRGFIVEGLKQLYGCESLVDLCRQRSLHRTDGREFGDTANMNPVGVENRLSTSRTAMARPSRRHDKSPGGRPAIDTATNSEIHVPGQMVPKSGKLKPAEVPEILQLTTQPTAKPIMHRGPMGEVSQLSESEAQKPESPLPVQADAGLPKSRKTKTENMMW